MLPGDCKRRAKYSGLLALQRRLRHLKSIMARNIDVNIKAENIGLFFTLHSVSSSSNAFYTSEIIENNTSPNWSAFSASQFSKHANLASTSVVVLLWASTGTSDSPLCEWTVHFSGLVYVGDKIPNVVNEFTSNTVLFGMPEGYYTSPGSFVTRCPSPANASCVVKTKGNDAMKRPTAHNYVKRSYTVCNLQRIHTVRRAMLQTEISVQRLQVLIHRKLERESSLDSKKRTRESLLLQIQLLREELYNQRISREDNAAVIQTLRSSLYDRSRDLADSIQSLRKSRDDSTESRRTLINMREEILKVNSYLMTRRKQLISGLSFIYPIKEVPGKGYTICGVRLPNSEDFAGHDEITIAVALGFVCHYVSMISRFLHVPVRYPVKHEGSKSKITDHILEKLPDSEREFPLYSKGKDKLQFNYGVYLLNKNIAQLRFYCGITTHDLRATLPNLYSLLELRLGVKLEPIYVHLAKPNTGDTAVTAETVPDEVGIRVDGAETQSLDSLTLLRQSDSNCQLVTREDHGDQFVALSCSLDEGLNNIERYHQSQHGEGAPSKGFGFKRAYYQLEQLHHGQSGSEPVLLGYRHTDTEAVGQACSRLVTTAERDMPNLSSLQHYCECDAVLASGLCSCCGSGTLKDPC